MCTGMCVFVRFVRILELENGKILEFELYYNSNYFFANFIKGGSEVKGMWEQVYQNYTVKKTSVWKLDKMTV